MIELKRIYVELLKTRGELADSLGYDSYTNYAYENMGYSYSPDEMMNFIAQVGEKAYTVYGRLYYSALRSPTPRWSVANLVNTSYTVMNAMDAQFGDIYSYMLQHELYDIALSSDKRLNASFTTYIKSNSSPYLFQTTTGYMADFSTLMHEFGHFIDGYVNNNEQDSLEIAELCSQGMEMLSLYTLSSYATKSSYHQLVYLVLTSALDILWYQGLLSYFEHLAYALPYESLTEESLESLISEAQQAACGQVGVVTDLSMFILHLYLSPMYVQSYCTSVLPAIEMYLLEEKTPGAGLSAYKSIIYRTEEDFLTLLSSASLTSPFAGDAVKSIIDDLGLHLGAITSKYN